MFVGPGSQDQSEAELPESSWGDSVNAFKTRYLRTFSRLKLDEYVAYCWHSTHTREFAENFLDRLIESKKPKPKNIAVALSNKKEGNEKFVERKYDECVALYTGSIFLAPKNDPTLPLAYSNRSLVLYKMGYYSECINDIDMAISLGYDKSKVTKLLLRKANALRCSGNFEQAEKILAEIAKNPQYDRIVQTLRLAMAAGDTSHIKQVSFQLPRLAGGENKNFTSASNFITPHYSKKKGRHVIANHDINIGDVLFVERPFTFALQSPACNICCAAPTAPIPCPDCLDVAYCSPECRDKDMKTHRLECGHVDALKFLGMGYLSLRIVMTVSPKFDKFKKIWNGLKEFKYKKGKISWNKTPYERVYNLISHIDKYEPSESFHFVMTAVLITLYMKKYTNYFPKNATDEDFMLFAEAIWRHIMQLICNCYAIVEGFKFTLEGKMVKKEDEQVGSGLYTSACLMNHSCEPSVMFSFYRDYFIIRASKAIKKGEEVFSCYGASARNMGKFERLEILEKQYFFRCECQHCLSYYDLKDVFKALKCPHCKGPLIPKNDEKEHIRYCLDCNETTELSDDMLDKWEKSIFLYVEGDSLMESNVPLAMARYLHSWRVAREISYKFNQNLPRAACKIATCLSLLKDYRLASRFLRCAIMCIEKQYGPFSIECAKEAVKYGGILLRCATHCFVCTEKDQRDKALEGLEWYERAEKIYSTLYGPQFEELDEIVEYKRNLEVFYMVSGSR